MAKIQHWNRFTLPALRALGCLLILAALLSGCLAQPRLEVESGDYTLVRGTDDATRSAADSVRNLYIDRDASIAVLTLDDNSDISMTFVARDRSQWPEGCPTNIYSHYMEVLDIDQPELTLGSLTLYDPVLVRDCPGEPVEVVLREDGQIGGGGGARTDSSLIFSYPLSSVPQTEVLDP